MFLLAVVLIGILLPPMYDPAIRLKWRTMGYDPLPKIPTPMILLFGAMAAWGIYLLIVGDSV